MSSETKRAPVEDAAAPGEAEGEGLLELVLAEHARRAPAARIDGVVVGRLVAIGDGGGPVVDFAESARGPAPARAVCAVAASDIGREVALLFEGGDPARPVLMGLMHAPARAPVDAEEPAPAAEATRDGERLVFEADKEIVLKCGEASITLTRAGKIVIRGAYLVSRASGTNRILGGAVEIN